MRDFQTSKFNTFLRSPGIQMNNFTVFLYPKNSSFLPQWYILTLQKICYLCIWFGRYIWYIVIVTKPWIRHLHEKRAGIKLGIFIITSFDYGSTDSPHRTSCPCPGGVQKPISIYIQNKKKIKKNRLKNIFSIYLAENPQNMVNIFFLWKT